MKKYLIDVLLCLLLAGVVATQYTIGFSRLYLLSRDHLSRCLGPEGGGGAAPTVDGDTSPACENVTYDRAAVDEALKCFKPFEDPRGDVSATDRPAGHSFFLILFAVFLPLAAFVALFRNRRDVAAWFVQWRAGPLMTPSVGRTEAILAFSVFAVAVFTRVFKLGSWVVEESEWGAVERLPLADLMFHGREVAHEPPLFTTLQHFVYAINDSSLAWTRSLTCLTGILLVMAVWRSSRLIFGPKTALLASALAAVHPFMVANSHVMRPYSLASFFLVMLLPHAWRMASGGRKRDCAALAIFGGLAIWTHYTALIVLLVLFLYLAAGIAMSPEDRLARLRRLLVAGLVLLVFFLPFLPYFLADFADKQGSGISPEFVDDMLAALTGLPLGAGWAVLAFPVLTGLRRARSGRFLMFLSAGIVAVMVATVWMVWWEPTHMAFLAPLLMMVLAASAVRLKARFAPLMIAPFFVAMAVMTGVLFSLPSKSPVVWEAARPMTWHGMSYRLYADRVREIMQVDPARRDCADIYVTPVDQVSGFMYYWGPVTPQQIGMRPIEPNNFKTFEMPVKVGRDPVQMRLHPIERIWSWDRGQWMDLELALREHGCMWYHKSYQNCATGTGRFFSGNDCAWLADNCRAEVSMPDGELYFCSRGKNP